MLRVALQAFVVLYLPGALLVRLPVGDRHRRAELAAEERVFWGVILSLAWSLSVVLVLAAFDSYRFERLLFVNGLFALVIALTGRLGLRLGPAAARVRWTAALPLLLVVLGLWRFFPVSEYVIGGKDPGTYMNQGIQMAQRGTLTIHDPVVAAVPDYARDLFFPRYNVDFYYSSRFMGFYLRDPRAGEITGQFPQLYPASLAVGYGLYGLTGARMTTAVWAMLGLVAVYFLGMRLVGRAAAFAGASLLALNVVEVWFARYPNSELVLQPLLFAALLAFARAHQDGDRFFAPVAGVLTGLLLFTRIEALPILASLLAAGMLAWLVDRRAMRVRFLVPLALAIAAAWAYYHGPLYPYMRPLFDFLRFLPTWSVAGGLAAIVAAFVTLLLMRSRYADRARRLAPAVLAAAVALLAFYGAFLREPGGRLAEHDAHALRTFVSLYLLWPGLAASVVGFVLTVRRDFWRDPAFIVVFASLSVFFFYKMRIPPIEFWAARRWLPVILPGALLFAAAAGLGPGTRWRWPRRAAGLAVLAVLGYQYSLRAAPVMPHVEYAGMIPALERLASRFTDHDLVLVESRDAGSDTHVLALPLAYIYARNVLVLNSARPDKLQLRAFLESAQALYRQVYFVGGGGTDLLSRRISARPVDDARIKVPEFESTAGTLPSAVRRKDFDYSVYELSLRSASEGPFSLDVGSRDDLNVVRFHAKETSEGRTVRWTGPQSIIAVPGMTGAEREVVLVLHDGGRPAQAPRAHVDAYLGDTLLGGIDVGAGFRPYHFAIPPEAAVRAAASEDPAQLRLVSTVWTPQQFFGGSDDRRLGVMLDRVEVR